MGEAIHSFLTLLGRFSVVSDGSAVTHLYFPTDNLPAMESGEDGIASQLERELNEFLSGGRTYFDVPFRLEGTDFQLDVWDAMCQIPYGETRSYGELAEMAGHPGAARAVGTACRLNPVPIIVPCHRVLPASGEVGRYSGGSEMKRRLLEIERGGGVAHIRFGRPSCRGPRGRWRRSPS